MKRNYPVMELKKKSTQALHNLWNRFHESMPHDYTDLTYIRGNLKKIENILDKRYSVDEFYSYGKGKENKPLQDHNCHEIEKDAYELVVVECAGCGFHLGIDYSYLNQVDTITTNCPSCKLELTIVDEE